MESVAVKINRIHVFLPICAHIASIHTLLMVFKPAYIRANYIFHTNIFSSHYPFNFTCNNNIYNVAYQYSDLKLA